MEDQLEGVEDQSLKVFVKSLSFNDGQKFDFGNSDIVIFTGANNSGKSQILRDVLQYFLNNDKKMVKVINHLEGLFLGSIKEYFNTAIVNSNGYYWVGQNTYQTRDSIERLWNNQQFVVGFHSIFINFLSTEQRLTSSNAQSSFDSLKSMPTHPIQELFIDDEKEKELSKYFRQAFGVDLIVDRGAGDKIPLFVGEAPPIDKEKEDRVSRSYRERLVSLPTLQEQGDGMRSYVSILLDAFTAKHTITLIDEPEAFLHPPQARLLGKMLAKNTPNTRQLFISTHSEDFLKGLLDADNKNVKIIRINRSENINHISLLKNEDIKRVWKDPILRYSNILSGLFHSKVVICESDSDCRFYQAIMNSMYDEKNDISQDVLFTHCGGKQRLKTVINALRSLNVRVAVIADIDVLNDKEVLKDIITSLRFDFSSIERDWNILDSYVKTQRPQLNKDEVKSKIEKLLSETSNSEMNLSKEIADEISKVVKMSTAWSKIKEVGKDFFKGESFTSFERIENICCTNGLFIVPVGELESFYRPATNHGPKWVNEVLENVKYLNEDMNLRSAREFINKIIAF